MATVLVETAEGFVAHSLAYVGGMVTDVEFAVDGILGPLRIVSFRGGVAPAYAILSGVEFHARVNGEPVTGGLRVLRHKDELVIGAVRMFFSAVSTPLVEIYRHDGAHRRPRCPTCRSEVLDQQSVVRCPGCARIYHQIAATAAAAAKPCWEYSPTCRFCDHPTSLSGAPAWRPAEES